MKQTLRSVIRFDLGLLVASATFVAPCFGESAPGNGNAKGSSDASENAGKASPNGKGPVQDPSEHRAVFDDIKSSAKSNDRAAIEVSVGRLVVYSTPNTANWHFEAVHHLALASTELAREGQSSALRAAASASIDHLSQAAALTTDVGTKARAKSMTATVYERFMGDIPSAITSYQDALKLNPKDPAANEQLVRLQRAEANLRAKIHPAKR